MKTLLSTIVLCFLGFSVVFAQSYVAEIQQYRDSIDLVFANPEKSPIPKEDLIHFKGITYFSVDPAYRVKAVFEPHPGPVFEMKTSTDRLPKYQRYGVLTFMLQGKSHTLTVYQNLDLMKRPGYEDYLFCPFYDDTCGDESYGSGRYLDFQISDMQDPVIDFNKSYNPYCAYNHRYSCPVPPRENFLDCAVKAGVKAWEH